MPDSTINEKNKAVRIGGKGTPRRKVVKSRPQVYSTPTEVSNTINSFKKNQVTASNISAVSLQYEDQAQVYINPDVKVILQNKEPVCYFVTGKSKFYEMAKENSKKNESEIIDLDPVKAAAMREMTENN